MRAYSYPEALCSSESQIQQVPWGLFTGFLNRDPLTGAHRVWSGDWPWGPVVPGVRSAVLGGEVWREGGRLGEGSVRALESKAANSWPSGVRPCDYRTTTGPSRWPGALLGRQEASAHPCPPGVTGTSHSSSRTEALLPDSLSA